MIIKSVSFNVQDPDQKAMLEHAGKRPNFSGYVKRLIQRDMETRPRPITPLKTRKSPIIGDGAEKDTHRCY